MPDIQEVFNRMQETKKEISALRKNYKELLLSTPGYEEAVEKISGHKLHKLQIETRVKEQMGKEFDDMERLKKDLASDAVLLSDMAVTQFMKGESIAIEDAYKVPYEPVFQVKFKKTT